MIITEAIVMFIKMQHCKRNRLPFSVAIVHFQGLGFVKVRAEVGLDRFDNCRHKWLCIAEYINQ
jgi:hypothetical protein